MDNANHNTLADKAAPTPDALVPKTNDVATLIRPRLTTEELAAILRVKPQTIRAGLCNAGHYAGLRPVAKLPSRRLLWDAEQVALVINS